MSDPNRSVQIREKILAPGEFMFVQDGTKGLIRTFVGSTSVNPAGQDAPVVYDSRSGFKKVDIEEAVQRCPIAVEGHYMILHNPPLNDRYPVEGQNQAGELAIGRKVNIPGPWMQPLWPGMTARCVRGHHLRSNQYLVVRIYNEEEARKNWTKAVVKAAEEGAKETVQPLPLPKDLAVGKVYIIEGTKVSFYIPPTGVTVVADDEETSEVYVRDAVTLRRLSWAALVDEDGNKRIVRGPAVVFPRPTEQFVKDDEGNAEFPAIELNEIQGIHIKVTADYVEEDKTPRKEGDEIFITGKDQAIYFPRPEHSFVDYDRKVKHFAVAIPSGEARYVMGRKTGDIRTVRGPAMLLPNPVEDVIVRRVLTDKECEAWYPGNAEALAYNQDLRKLQVREPTTRRGVVSNDVASQALGGVQTSYDTASSPLDALAAGTGPAYKSRRSSGQSLPPGMDRSRVGKEATAGMVDHFTRSATFTQPRTLTLDTKFEGAPRVVVWTGYAINVVGADGHRRIEIGPKNVLLDYDETLDVMELSTGKPKTTDKLYRTAYLRVKNNKVGDVIEVETKDHVRCQVKVSLRVDFEGDGSKWFDAENYVKLLCDHVRSIMKGGVKRIPIEEFYVGYVDIVRNLVLGEKVEGKRTGLVFPENGMCVVDVEVLGLSIVDNAIGTILNQAQVEAVQSGIEITRLGRLLDVTRSREAITRETMDARWATVRKELEIANIETTARADVEQHKIDVAIAQQQAHENLQVVKEAVANVSFGATLSRSKETLSFEESAARARLNRELEKLTAETGAVVERFKAAGADFTEALLALSRDEILEKVAQATNVQRMIGGESLVDAVRAIVKGTPLEAALDRVAASKPNGNRAIESGR